MPHLPSFVWLILSIIFGSMAYAGIRAAPYFSTRRKDKSRCLDAAGIKAGDKVYDLGCGNGWFVCQAAARGACAIGFELSLSAYAVALVRSWSVKGPGTVRIKFGDFWHADISDADVVFAYLTPRVMDKLRLKLERECRPGTRAVSYVFDIPGWQAKETVNNPGGFSLNIYDVPRKATSGPSPDIRIDNFG